jgi:hypothetical protein
MTDLLQMQLAAKLTDVKSAAGQPRRWAFKYTWPEGVNNLLPYRSRQRPMLGMLVAVNVKKQMRL